MNDASNRYDGEVRSVDVGVARLVALLRESGEYEDTLIVLCSDHGEMLYEKPNFPYLIKAQIDAEGGLPGGVKDLFGAGHRPWYYEDLWRTPLIFAGPGFPSAERRSGLAANLDIFPTLLEALGLPLPPYLRGESLLGAREPRRERVFAHGHKTTAVLDRNGAKLVVHLPKMYLRPRKSDPPLELYDLSHDADELSNLAETHADRARALLDAINGWRDENEREVIDTTTERALQILREMGYVGEDEEP
jgi:arylsulfatase A-like enzyme